MSTMGDDISSEGDDDFANTSSDDYDSAYVEKNSEWSELLTDEDGEEIMDKLVSAEVLSIEDSIQIRDEADDAAKKALIESLKKRIQTPDKSTVKMIWNVYNIKKQKGRKFRSFQESKLVKNGQLQQISAEYNAADIPFTETNGFNSFMTALKKSSVVILTGMPGDGKTSVLNHYVKKLNLRKAEAIFLQSFTELQSLEVRKDVIYLFDDVTSTVPVSMRHSSDVMKKIDSAARRFKSTTYQNRAKLVIVFQKDVLNFLKIRHENSLIWSRFPIIDLSKSLNEIEKIQILQNFGLKIGTENANTCNLAEIDFEWGFPKCCRIVSSNSTFPSKKDVDISNIFNCQVEVLEDYFGEMEGPSLAVLASIASHGNTVDRDFFSNACSNEMFFQNIFVLCGCEFNHSMPLVMSEIASAFQGVFLAEDTRKITVNGIVSEAINRVLLKKHPSKFITWCPFEILSEFFKKESESKSNVLFLKAYIRNLLVRITSKLENPNIDYAAFLEMISHMYFWSKPLCRRYVDQYIEIGERIRHLIPTGSLFVFFQRNVSLSFLFCLYQDSAMLKIVCRSFLQKKIKNFGTYIFASDVNVNATIAEKTFPYLLMSETKSVQQIFGHKSLFLSLDVAYDMQLANRFATARQDTCNTERSLFDNLAETYMLDDRGEEKFDPFYILEIGIKHSSSWLVKLALIFSNQISYELFERMVTTFKNHSEKKKLKVLGCAVALYFRKCYKSTYDIKDVWAGHSMKNSALDTLVVITNSSKPTNLDMRTFAGLSLLVRRENELSEESNEMLKFENKCADLLSVKLSPETVQSLLRSHANISLISASCVRSKGFETKESKIYHIPCVVLYCPVKGIIPAGEMPFPSVLEGHEVDIREAVCTFAANNEPLCVGDEIRSPSSNSIGTLGGFVDLPGRCSKGFITCAHVVFTSSELKSKTFETPQRLARVFKEITDESDSRIGVVERAVFKDDSYEGTSVDAALIKLHHSTPVVGSFSKKMRKEDIRRAAFFDESPHFSYGGTENVTLSNVDSKIVKIGAVSGLTSGRIKFTDAIFRDMPISFKDNFLNVTLRGQIEIIPEIDPSIDSKDRPPFLSLGDSGSFIFMVTRKTPLVLKCIGMAVARTSFGSCLVTPIEPILEALELPLDCLTKFRDLPEEGMDLRSFLISIKSDVNQIRSEMNTDLNDIKAQLASQDQKIRRIDSERTKCIII